MLFDFSAEKERTALSIVTTLTSRGYQALFAGGCVRDRLLGLGGNGDIDIATNATPQTIAAVFSRTTAVGEAFGVMVVMIGDHAFEVATFRSDAAYSDGRRPDAVVFTDAKTDAQRRDFTINGMFYDPLTDAIIDYVNGQGDLRDKTIRAIGDPQKRLSEDYLRLLRAVRFAVRFGFDIDPATWQAIVDTRDGIKHISMERIFQEFSKMLMGPHADHSIGLLDESGLLSLLLPEVSALKGIEQPKEFHPEGDVFLHTLKALGLLETPSPVLAWSTLLHDVGKPSTMEVRDRIRFNNHNRVGAAMAQSVLRRLKAPLSLIEAVSDVIDNHMAFINVQNMRLSTLKKFLARPTLDDELQMHRADCLASHGDISNYTFLNEKKAAMPPEIVRPEPFIRGADLIALGMTPGPVFGKILQAAYDQQLDDAFPDGKDQALVWVQEHLGEY